MTSDHPSLLVLAAGLGTRYGGLKQLEQIGPSGETLMDYSIHDARMAGFSRVVFLIREEMREQFDKSIGEKYRGIIEVDYAYQRRADLPGSHSCPEGRERPWGTGHAVWAARNVLGGDSFAVINADDYYGSDTFDQLMACFSEPTKEVEMLTCAMVGFRLSDTLSAHGQVSRGICQTEEDRLAMVEEWTQIGGDPLSGYDSRGKQGILNGDEVVSMNVWAFPPEIFSLLEARFVAFLENKELPPTAEFYLPSAIDQGISSGILDVRVRQASCSWMGVTHREDKTQVVSSIAELVKRGVYRSPLLD